MRWEGECPAAVTELKLPPTLKASFQGNVQVIQGSLSSTPVLIVAALIAVYIILGMLHENLDPSPVAKAAE